MILHKLMKSLIVVPLLCAAQIGFAQQVYEATKDTTKIFVIGSSHTPAGKPYNLNPQTAKAIQQADVVILEHYSAQRATKMPEFWLATKPQDYKGIPDLAKCLTERFGSPTAGISKLEQLRPLFAAQMLGTLYNDKNAKMYDSIDGTITKLALAAGKPIQSLEPDEKAVEVFNALSNDEEMEYLRGSARLCVDSKMNEAYKARQQEMNDLVLNGTHQQIIEKQTELEQLFGGSQILTNKIIRPRNETLYQDFVKLIQGNKLGTNKTYAVVIGAFHAGGEGGMVDRLKQDGYAIKESK